MSSQPDAIFNIVSPDYLPLEYGGNHGVMEDISHAMETKLSAYAQYFLASQHFGTVEKFRDVNSQPQDKCCTFGAVGSFRKLEID